LAFRVLEDGSAIRRCQRQLVGRFKPFADEKISVIIGHMGESFKARVTWSHDLGIWFLSKKLTENRYWNAFGIGKPAKGASISSTCEISFPLNGLDRRVTGAFVKDSTGRIFMVHRGKIGGGRKGIGKSLFESEYRGVWAVAEDGDMETAVVVVGQLESPRFARQVAKFVHKVGIIKDRGTSRSPQTTIDFDEFCFSEELVGKEYCKSERTYDVECDWGLVVHDLASLLEGQGRKVANDGDKNLFIVDPAGRIDAIFEVEVDQMAKSLYAGAARLLLNSVNLSPRPRLILVVPGQPDKTFENKLRRMGIELLFFDWRGEKAVFPNLEKLTT
jgi:hypothetical protein